MKIFNRLKCLKITKRLAKDKKGTSIVLFAAALTVFAACAALTIDIGAVVVEKSKLSTAVDAAALAGLQEYLTGSGNTTLVAENYLNKNIDELESTKVTIGADNKSVQVTAVKKSDNYFSTMLKESLGSITATAVAKAETIKSMTGTRPLAVVQQSFIYGKQYTLKEGAGDGINGNYAAMALGDNGSSTYANNILYGYAGVVKVGDVIPTQTGNMVMNTVQSINTLINGCTHTPACTYTDYNSTCTRIISIPVVNTLDINGKKYVSILGFATFFLEGVNNSGGSADIIGRFITYSAQGETSSTVNDYGTYGIRLVK